MVLLNSNSTILLVIDVQEKILNGITNNKGVVWNIRRLVDSCNILNVEIIYTEQCPEKLGRTLEFLSRRIKTNAIRKLRFSCADLPEVRKIVESNSTQNIIVCGIETHVCVQQTIIELLSEGLNLYLPKDATGSRNITDHQTSIDYISSIGGLVNTTESIIFELCQTSDRLEFKAISKLIKEQINLEKLS